MEKFEYHTFLHHSQTMWQQYSFLHWFEYHTFLHHSQTHPVQWQSVRVFEYHTFLHHSQTKFQNIILNFSLSTIHFYIILKLFGKHRWLGTCLSTIHFYIILKPSNSKMKCHHSHKIQVLKLLGCYISHPSLSIIYLVTPSMQSLAQVSINKS